MAVSLTDRDIEEIRALIAANPGAQIRQLKDRSRHSSERVRAAIQHLERHDDVSVTRDGLTRHVWPVRDDAEDAGDGA